MKFNSSDEEFLKKYQDLWDTDRDEETLREVWAGLHPLTREALKGFYTEENAWTLYEDFKAADKCLRKKLFQMKLDELGD